MKLPKPVKLEGPNSEAEQWQLREHMRRRQNARDAVARGEIWSARIWARLARISLRRYHEMTSPYYTLKELLVGYHPAKPEKETDWGQDIGGEIISDDSSPGSRST
jgi:hypothetical protein